MPSRRQETIIIISILASGFIVLNVISFFHAYRFTHFFEEGARTRPPERLSRARKLAVLLTGVTVPKVRNQKTPHDIGCEFQESVVRSPDGIETPIWRVTTPGAKATVVMFHGYGGRKEALLPVAEFFQKQRCDVVLADLPGHGESKDNWCTLGYREAGVVKAVVADARREPGHKLILCGVSLGASSILRAVAHEHVQADALILEMPYGSMLDTVQRRFELMRFPVTFPFAQLLVFWGGAQFGFNAFQLDGVADARAVTIPTLLLGGEKDYRVSPETLDMIFQNLSGRKSRVIFQNARHDLLIEADRELYEKLVMEFLRVTGL